MQEKFSIWINKILKVAENNSQSSRRCTIRNEVERYVIIWSKVNSYTNRSGASVSTAYCHRFGYVIGPIMANE